MAIYEHLCRTCDHVVAVRATLSEKIAGLQPTCPSCGGTDLRRVFTPIGVVGATRGPQAAPAAGGGGCCGGGCGCG